MRRHFMKSSMAVLAGMAILGVASPAGAVTVTYSTVGTFLGGDTPNSGVYTDTDAGILIRFEGVTSDTVDAPSQASFGTFNTTGTAAEDLSDVSSDFRLEIFQTAPEIGGPAVFVGTLMGSLSATASTAFVQFDQPLSQIITGASTQTTYRILEADTDPQGNAVPGRANINPPSTASGVSSVEGFITTTTPVPIPEPSTLLMGALAAPAVLICLRRKGRGTV